MKKVTLISLVLMGLLVTGLGAIVIGSGNVKEKKETQTDPDKKNAPKAKDNKDSADDALKDLKKAGDDSSKCKAFAKVKRYCKMINSYDDDSTSDGDSDSKDDVSDYKKDADKILAMAMKFVSVKSCKKEIECEELKNKFFYNVDGKSEDKKKNLVMMNHCGNMKSKHEDGKSKEDDKSKEDNKSEKDD